MSDAKDSIEGQVKKFAEDIVTCVMQKRHSDWMPTKTYEKGEAIHQYENTIIDFCEKNELGLRNEWWQYFNGKEKNIQNYEKFCNVMKSIILNMEFSVGKLLAHLLKLSEFAAHLYDTGCTNAPNFAIEFIGEILLNYPGFLQEETPIDHSSNELCI